MSDRCQSSRSSTTVPGGQTHSFQVADLHQHGMCMSAHQLPQLTISVNWQGDRVLSRAHLVPADAQPVGVQDAASVT